LKIHHPNLSFPTQINFLWASWWINECCRMTKKW
jgi:hypothetical protein